MNRQLVLAYFLIALVTAAFLCGAYLVSSHFSAKPAGFSPPGFELNALPGGPDTQNIVGWREFNAADAYTVGICGELWLKDGVVDVYLSSPLENDVWLKLRILDESGEILGETGLIMPGQYVKSVAIERKISRPAKVLLKVMAYEPESYLSAGSVVVETFIMV